MGVGTSVDNLKDSLEKLDEATGANDAVQGVQDAAQKAGAFAGDMAQSAVPGALYNQNPGALRRQINTFVNEGSTPTPTATPTAMPVTTPVPAPAATAPTTPVNSPAANLPYSGRAYSLVDQYIQAAKNRLQPQPTVDPNTTPEQFFARPGDNAPAPATTAAPATMDTAGRAAYLKSLPPGYQFTNNDLTKMYGTGPAASTIAAGVPAPASAAPTSAVPADHSAFDRNYLQQVLWAQKPTYEGTGTPADQARWKAQNEAYDSFAKHFMGTMDVGTKDRELGIKETALPAEIAKNTGEANYYNAHGVEANARAAGMPRSFEESLAQTTAAHTGKITADDKMELSAARLVSKAQAEPFLSADPALLKKTIDGIWAAHGLENPDDSAASTAKGTKPTLAQFMVEARKSPQNKSYSDDQLKAYFQKKYGGV